MKAMYAALARRRPEREVQKQIIIYLRRIGALVAVTDSGASHVAGGWTGSKIPTGWPDLTCCLPGGRFCGIECKADNGKQSPFQADMQKRIEKIGGIYILARCVGDVVEALLPQS
jgi:hypothetical protein